MIIIRKIILSVVDMYLEEKGEGGRDASRHGHLIYRNKFTEINRSSRRAIFPSFVCLFVTILRFLILRCIKIFRVGKKGQVSHEREWGVNWNQMRGWVSLWEVG
jgi:hypothetical protein